MTECEKTLDKTQKFLRDNGYKFKKSKPTKYGGYHLSFCKKKTYKVEIFCHLTRFAGNLTIPSLSTNVYIRTKFGGYKLTQGLLSNLGYSGYLNDHEILDLLHDLDKTLNPVEKSETKRNKDIELIQQNIICRLLQSKLKQNSIKHKTSYLANFEKNSYAQVDTSYVCVCIFKERIEVGCYCLNSKYHRSIYYELASPKFDPGKFCDKIVQLHYELDKLDNQVFNMSKNFLNRVQNEIGINKKLKADSV